MLRKILVICFQTLDTYGKEPEALAGITQVFLMVLGRFNFPEVEKAFQIYLEKGNSMPKPADIVKIIEPPVEQRKWCGATFIDIKRRWRENQFITDAEKKYCSDFIAAKITAPEQERALIEDSIRQVTQQEKQYWLEQP